MEENYTIKEIDPLLLFGANNQRIKQIIKLFPKLKIVARGNNLKINGNEEEVIRFTNKLDLFVAHILRYGALTENQLERLMEEDAQEIVQNTFWWRNHFTWCRGKSHKGANIEPTKNGFGHEEK